MLNLFFRNRDFKDKLEASRERLYRIAYSWSHDPVLADDIVQETLAKALKNISQLRDSAAFSGWLFKIMANCWRDYFRRRRETVNVDYLELRQESTPETEYYRHQLARKVRLAVAKLPDGQRQVLTLVDLEELSYIEVADVLQVPIGTSSSHFISVLGIRH